MARTTVVVYAKANGEIEVILTQEGPCLVELSVVDLAVDAFCSTLPECPGECREQITEIMQPPDGWDVGWEISCDCIVDLISGQNRGAGHPLARTGGGWNSENHGKAGLIIATPFKGNRGWGVHVTQLGHLPDRTKVAVRQNVHGHIFVDLVQAGNNTKLAYRDHFAGVKSGRQICVVAEVSE